MVRGRPADLRRPAAAPDLVLDGWVMPGLVDAHCHIGLGPGGDVTEDTAEDQALTDRNAGTLLVRDAGAVHDTRWLQQRADLPRIIRSGRHIARTRRYLPGFAVEVEPGIWWRPCVSRPARATAGSSSWGTGSTATPATSPPVPGRTVKDAVRAAHDEGARVTAHCFAEDTLDDMLDAGIDCIEHATGLLPRHLPRFVEQGVPIVPTLINIATFPDIAAQAEAKFPRYAAHMRSLWERRAERILEAFEAGRHNLRRNGRRQRHQPWPHRGRDPGPARRRTPGRGRPRRRRPGPRGTWLGRTASLKGPALMSWSAPRTRASNPATLCRTSAYRAAWGNRSTGRPAH